MIDKIAQAAANKAAEEGGLPALESGPFYELFKFTVGSLAVHNLVEAREIGEKFRALIRADRASRQVANKVEVEPIGYVNADELDNMLDDRTATIQSARSGWRATPIYATPPATTGASTARDQALEDALQAIGGVLWEFENKVGMQDEVYGAERCKEAVRALFAKPVGASTVLTNERKRAMFEEWATKQGGYDLSPYNWRVKSVGGVPYTGYVRPYKQDRTVHAFEGFVAALGEVAAQAGQVAVPAGWTVKQDGDGVHIEDSNGRWCVYERDTPAHRLICEFFEDLIGAAPSPAKESK